MKFPVIESDDSYKERRLQSGFFLIIFSFIFILIIVMIGYGIYIYHQDITTSIEIIIFGTLLLIIIPGVNYFTFFHSDIFIQKVIINDNNFTPSHRPLKNWIRGQSYHLEYTEITKWEQYPQRRHWKYPKGWITIFYINYKNRFLISGDVDPTIHKTIRLLLEKKGVMAEKK